MRISLSSLLAPASCLVFTATLLAQTAPPAAPKNLIGNGGFETGFRRDDLWDGVSSSGTLSGNRGALPVLTTSGTVADTSMPVSVSVADMNGDGLPDIAAMDVLGYLRIYFNTGTKTEPKFGLGELSELFLTRLNPADPTLQGLKSVVDLRDHPEIRQGQRIFLTDSNRSGKMDLIIGNYLGEILLIPNSGSGVRPEFRQPGNMASVLIPTMKDSLKKWGNVFAPAVWDWNHDGKDDLLVGEGSYSANSIHILLNQGSGSRPSYNETNHTVLAYGMGLEQLTPCVVDYNGDGVMDLLVTERTGKVAIYLSQGKTWKPGQQLSFDSFIRVGGGAPATPAVKDPMDAAKQPGLLSVSGIATIAAGDFNGDGLFDLVFGKSNGSVAMSLNTGTKTEPKFSTPVEVKGDAATPSFNSPSGWECDYGLARGNFYGFFSVVKGDDDPAAQPAEGKACLKAGYTASPNKFIPVPKQYSPPFDGWKNIDKDTPNTYGAPANFFTAEQSGRSPLKTNTTYIFTMKVKGSKVSDAFVTISYRGLKTLSDAKITRETRNAVKIQKNEAEENKSEVIKFTAGSQWSEVKKEFTVKFSNKDLSDLQKVTNWGTGLGFILSPGPGGGVLYVDDVKVIEKQ